MDFARERRGPSRSLILFFLIAISVITIVVAAVALWHAAPNGYPVDRTSVLIDVVKMQRLEISVSASGVLASEDVRTVSSTQPGVVTNVFVRPGSDVRAGTPIAQLENPALTAAVVDARSSLEAARAQVASAREEAQASSLTQQSSLAGAQAQMQEDSTNAQSYQSLHRGGLIADSTYRIAKIHAAQSRRQLQISQSQVSVIAAEEAAKVAQAQAQVDTAAAQLSAAQSQVAALTITAGGDGVVESVLVNGGSHVDMGAQIATIADQRALKAVLQVPETQVHDVRIGMMARVDAGSGAVNGRVANIAPSAESGTVGVDVSLPHLPPGARPALTVDGTIIIDDLAQTLSIIRPVGATDNSTVQLYKLDSGGNEAELVTARLGRGSVTRVQVLAGLGSGDRVIVSDTTSYDGHPILRLH
jgi:HlyD family secretion protein